MLLDKSGKHIASNMEEDELVDELVKLFDLDAADFETLKARCREEGEKGVGFRAAELVNGFQLYVVGFAKNSFTC